MRGRVMIQYVTRNTRKALAVAWEHKLHLLAVAGGWWNYM
jgi:hypothetical protein